MALKRTLQMKVRVTTAEYLKIKNTAARAGLSISGFFRKRCLDDSKIIIQDPETMKDIYRELNLLGSNVNQVARVVHATKVVHKAVLLEMLDLIRDIRLEVCRKLKGIKC